MRTAPSIRHLPGGLRLIWFALVHRLGFGRLDGRGDHVLLAGPIAEVDDLATLAAEWKEFITGGDRLLADRALHRIAARMGKGGATGTHGDSAGESIRAPIKS